MDRIRFTRYCLLVALAALLQLIPAFFGEEFVLVTVLSALPIYFVSRSHPQHGIAAYLAAGLLVSVFSMHEGLFFFFANGTVGLVLGTLKYYTEEELMIVGLSSIILVSALCTINYIVGIPVFGFEIPGPMLSQIIALSVFAMAYNMLYSVLAERAYRCVRRRIRK